ncbi:MAG: polysaccharide deacetylase family protein [Nitrospirota bacterium]
MVSPLGNTIKKGVSLIAYLLLPWRGRSSSSLTILTYHRITDEPDPEDSLIVSLRSFEHQIIFLKRHYNVIPGEELAEIIKNGRSFPEKACLITFDDGWRDNYTHAFPVLRAHGVPALIFISTDFIGTHNTFWHERLLKVLTNIPSHTPMSKYENIFKKLPEGLSEKIVRILKMPVEHRRPGINALIEDLKKFDLAQISQINRSLEVISDLRVSEESPTMLLWEDVEEMSMNNISFGSHTKSHPILTQISDRQIKEELIESKGIIEDRLRKPVHFLCYPNGNYNEAILKMTEEAGYLAGFSCIPGINHSFERRFEFKRRHIVEDFSLNLKGQFSELFFKVELSGVRLALVGLVRKKEEVW